MAQFKVTQMTKRHSLIEVLQVSVLVHKMKNSSHFRPWCVFLGGSRGHTLQCSRWDQDQDSGSPLCWARVLWVQGPERPHPQGRSQGADHPQAPREHEGRRHQVALRLVQEVQRRLRKPHLPHWPQCKTFSLELLYWYFHLLWLYFSTFNNFTSNINICSVKFCHVTINLFLVLILIPFQLPKSQPTDLPAPLAPVDNSVSEPEPEPESEPEPEPEHDHDGHDHGENFCPPHKSRLYWFLSLFQPTVSPSLTVLLLSWEAALLPSLPLSLLSSTCKMERWAEISCCVLYMCIKVKQRLFTYLHAHKGELKYYFTSCNLIWCCEFECHKQSRKVQFTERFIISYFLSFQISAYIFQELVMIGHETSEIMLSAIEYFYLCNYLLFEKIWASWKLFTRNMNIKQIFCVQKTKSTSTIYIQFILLFNFQNHYFRGVE